MILVRCDICHIEAQVFAASSLPDRWWTALRSAGVEHRCPSCARGKATSARVLAGHAAVRDVLREHPGISAAALAATLAERGMRVNPETARRWRAAVGLPGARPGRRRL